MKDNGVSSLVSLNVLILKQMNNIIDKFQTCPTYFPSVSIKIPTGPLGNKVIIQLFNIPFFSLDGTYLYAILYSVNEAVDWNSLGIYLSFHDADY